MPKVSDFTVLKQVKQPALIIRKNIKITELPKVLGESFQKISIYLDELGEMLTDVPYVAFHNFRILDENNVDIEIGFPLSKEVKGKDEIQFITIPEQKIVFCFYKGDYGETGPVYEEMQEWIESKGYELKGDCYEYYLNGPPFPMEEMLTKIVIPVK